MSGIKAHCAAMKKGAATGDGAAIFTKLVQAGAQRYWSPTGKCTATSTSFWTIFSHFSATLHTCYALLGAQADRVLIGAWNPMLCPNLGLQAST